MKLLFIGHFSDFDMTGNEAISPAGDLVQSEILENLRNINHHGHTKCISMHPMASWPNGKLIHCKHAKKGIDYIFFVNLPILKHIIFAILTLSKIIIYKPAVIVQYNSYLFENLVLNLYKLIAPNTKLVCILQDINITKNHCIPFRKWIKEFLDYLSLQSLRFFNLIVPISEYIIEDFNLPKHRCFVFQGGITSFSNSLIHNVNYHLKDYAVFAGSLEPHNGIDILINKWLEFDLKVPLHVFGRGSLSKYVEERSQMSEFIIFHGFHPPEIVQKWQIDAKINFCLRYDAGLNSRYFFPSKLFNIASCCGGVFINEFAGLPKQMREYSYVLNEDLSNLATCVTAKINAPFSLEDVSARHHYIQKNFDWSTCVDKIFDFLKIV